MKIFNIIALFLLVTITACGKNYAPAGNALPALPDTGKLPGLRVLSYNIHHANPPSKPNLIDVDAIAAVINHQHPDLVALQEIDVNTDRSGKTLHEAEYIAAKTGMKAYFAKSIDYGGGAYGVAILSKYPMEGMKQYALPTAEGTNGEPRILATVQVTVPGNRKIVFACTHLDAQSKDTNRVMQIQKIVEILKKETLPVIVAGDLNADPQSATIGILDTHFKRSCINGCGFTIPEVNPRKTIDYISFAPASAFRVQEHLVINENYASDHLPVFAILELQ